MTFEEFLKDKKINAAAFQTEEPTEYVSWAALFEQISVASFTAQKLYLINAVRRKYLLKDAAATKPPQPPAASRPIFKPKIK